MTRQKTGWTLLAMTLVMLLLTFPVVAKGGKAHNPNNGHGKITAVSATSISVTPKAVRRKLTPLTTAQSDAGRQGRDRRRLVGRSARPYQK